MEKSNRSPRFLFVLLLSVLPSAASAMVMAMPSYSDFGPVLPGRFESTTITFVNTSPRTIRFFDVNCSGDTSVFNCFSSCFMLQPHGSCSVQVQFTPRNGDDLRKSVWLNGWGDGEFSTATVYGTDQKPPKH